MHLSVNTEGEIVDVVEEDDGSGWVKVANAQGIRGLVPASYVTALDGDRDDKGDDDLQTQRGGSYLLSRRSPRG